MKRQKDTQNTTKKAGIILVTDINCFGSRFPESIYKADITEDKQSIRIHGNEANCKSGVRPFDITFKVGGSAVYGSYNLTYVGTIVSIGEKTITIETGSAHQPRKQRLTIGDFIWKNYNFDLEKIKAINAEWMD